MCPDREDNYSLTGRGRLGSQGVVGFCFPDRQDLSVQWLFHWKKWGTDVCVREAEGEDLEPTEHRVGSRSVASRSVHTAPRNDPRKPNENRKK